MTTNQNNALEILDEQLDKQISETALSILLTKLFMILFIWFVVSISVERELHSRGVLPYSFTI